MTKLASYIKKNPVSTVTLFIYFTFYLFFAFFDGAVICVDSPTYIGMDFAREPVYPLLLAFFRQFSEANYLFYTVIFQSCLAAISGWLLADYIRKKLNIHPLYSSILYLMPLCTSLLCRFAAARSSMYTNSILSEGIATPLYLLFIYFLMKYIFDNSKVGLWSCCFLSFLLISTRKQMLMVFPLLLAAVFFSYFKKKQFKAGLLTALVLCLLVFGGSKLLDCSYNFVLRGQFQSHSSDNRFISTMIFYNAQRKDADYIEDPQVKDIFLEIYDRCDEQGFIGSHAGESWLDKVSHFGNHYDHIQIDTMWPTILIYARENMNAQYAGQEAASLQPLYDLETDRINSVIISSILPHQIPKLLHTLYNNFLSGLVTTVAQQTPILILYTIFIYIAYLVLLIRLIWIYAKKKTCIYHNEIGYTILFSLVTMLGIICNVTLVSAVIFCQTRYTIYNMPLFYMAGAVLLYYNVLPTLTSHKKKQSDA